MGQLVARWYRVGRAHCGALALADRHYSRQTPGGREFLPPGRPLVLLTPRGDALWSVVENMDPAGDWRWRVTVFRNESPVRSSDLVREATATTYRFWRANYGGLPRVPLTTEVDPSKVRSNNPGYCFRCAGWFRVGVARGLVILQAPAEGVSW